MGALEGLAKGRATQSRQRVQGLQHYKRLMRNLDPAARQELGQEWNIIADRLLAQAKAEVPVRTGGLRAALDKRVTIRGGMILRIGLFGPNKTRYFYGWILDQGRKAQRAIVRHRRKDFIGPRPFYSKIGPRPNLALNSDGTIRYVNVRAIDRERYNFVFGRRKDFYFNYLPRLRGIWTRIIERASRGAGPKDA